MTGGTGSAGGAADKAVAEIVAKVEPLIAGDVDARAEDILSAGLEAHPEDTHLLLQRAALRQKMQKFPEAAQDAAIVVTNDRTNAQAHLRLASIFQDMGRADEAVMFQWEAVKLEPGNWSAYLTLGQMMREIGNFDSAVELAEAARMLAPDAPDVSVDLIDFLVQAGRVNDAITVGREARARFPHDVRILRNLGNALKWVGEKDEAIEVFEAIQKLDPNDGYSRHLIDALRGTATSQAHPEYVKDLFDGFADGFDERMMETLRYRVPGLVRRAVTQLTNRTDLSVLDLGCGTGLCAITVRDLATYIKGVDLSTGMVDVARRRGVYEETLVEDIITAMRADPRTYDFVIAGDVFVYMGDIAEALREARDRLLPGGHVLFTVERGPDDIEFALNENGRFTHGKPYLDRVAKAAGLEVVEIRPEGLRLEMNRPVSGWFVTLRRP